MYPELNFDVITLPCAAGIALHQDFFFLYYTVLKFLENKCFAIRLPGVLIQADRVNLNQFFVHSSLWFMFLLAVTT